MWLMTAEADRPSKDLAVETLKAIEAKKVETLSELSNPFRVARDKFETVIDLEVAKAKLTNLIEVDKGIASEEMFWAACEHYDMVKSAEESM